MTATAVHPVPILTPEWREPMVFITIGGSGNDHYGAGRIGTALGPLDETFYQRQLADAQVCADRGCAKRVVFRETFGRWTPEYTQVAATGWQDCPMRLPESWSALLEAPNGWELIQYIRYGTGQYGAAPCVRAVDAVTNLVAATVNNVHEIVASTAIDGLPEVAAHSLDALEINYLLGLIKASKSKAKVYGEAWPEQQTTPDAAALWGHLPAMSIYANVLGHPHPWPVINRGERIVIDTTSRTPAQYAAFLAECANHHWTPCVFQPSFAPLNISVAELQGMGGRKA